MNNDFAFRLIQPGISIASFVESFWELRNLSANDKEIVVLPDGRADLTFFRSATDPFCIVRSGIETYPQQALLKGKTAMFAVSFKLLAVEYIFGTSIAGILDYAEFLPTGFWNFSETDLENFDLFCQKATQQIQSRVPADMDSRKKDLFDLIYTRKGDISVKELSERVYWSSRQINRYFNEQFGLSLKAYCNIIRFRASFHHIKEGKLFPQQNFADQSHFIREIKKLSGVSPKELSRNQNGRFIQFSALPHE
ncbi:helix-turn-helix domain-containing protein [Niabella hibiscisoli]|uniref:helix-turn-helix domain-containing protein n=1 Tax=Niabella hibiscisoli TaxID=1825928 RepID=UPI001F0F90AB|nr:AraC family transcriptional regulator [Niabella hibiscisoli]MCH5720145.1 AraC family transcriptional regulator [Niabella hibiscisoli]